MGLDPARIPRSVGAELFAGVAGEPARAPGASRGRGRDSGVPGPVGTVEMDDAAVTFESEHACGKVSVASFRVGGTVRDVRVRTEDGALRPRSCDKEPTAVTVFRVAVE